MAQRETYSPLETASLAAPPFATRAQDPTDLSDSPLPESENPILPKIRRIVEESAWENFADGMESALSRKLHSLIQAHGGEAVRAISALIKNGLADSESAEEILRQVGYSEDSTTYSARLELLVDSLHSLNPRIRDAASLGVAAMDDPSAIEALEAAIERESSAMLRRNLTLALEQLRETKCQGS